uniref:Uncharacterized protein n=1 Tax=Siphoviridae sp. ctB3v5 TaxID=2826186 RepID=A0A8S5M983_9CAUD|nr:MAG TPA: hypothetical protein [Siphoviridae sp. ctB3v5]
MEILPLTKIILIIFRIFLGLFFVQRMGLWISNLLIRKEVKHRRLLRN